MANNKYSVPNIYYVRNEHIYLLISSTKLFKMCFYQYISNLSCTKLVDLY